MYWWYFVCVACVPEIQVSRFRDQMLVGSGLNSDPTVKFCCVIQRFSYFGATEFIRLTFIDICSALSGMC